MTVRSPAALVIPALLSTVVFPVRAQERMRTHEDNPVHFALSTGVTFPAQGPSITNRMGTALMFSSILRLESWRYELRFDGVSNQLRPNQPGEVLPRMNGGALGANFDLLRRRSTPYLGAGIGGYYGQAPQLGKFFKIGTHMTVGWRKLVTHGALFLEARLYSLQGSGEAGRMLPVLVGFRM